MYFARQLVSERLQQNLVPAAARNPADVGLPATAFGELYQYTLSGPMSAIELKDLHEWVIKGSCAPFRALSDVKLWAGRPSNFKLSSIPRFFSSTTDAA